MLAERSEINPHTAIGADVKLVPVFASLAWIGLCLLASLGALLLGVGIPDILMVAGAGLIPALLHLGLSAVLPDSDWKDIWVVFAWTGLSILGVLLTGTLGSPLVILFAMGPLYAVSVGQVRLGVEASVFAAVSYLALALLSVSGLPLPVIAWANPISGLGVMISILQIGAFLAVCINAFSRQRDEEKRLANWQEILDDAPVLILRLSEKGRVLSWLGEFNLLDGLSEQMLRNASILKVFENAGEFRNPDGRNTSLIAAWRDDLKLEGRLVTASSGGYRLIISPLQEDDLRADGLESQLKGQAQWVASLGHELKNMLNPVGGYSDLILSERAGPIAAPYQEFAKSIKQGAEHLGLLIDDLMTATKSRAGHLKLHIEALDLRLEIEDAIKLVSWQSGAHDVTVLLTDGPDVMVQADRKALRQILINLLSNAVKYSRASSKVTLTVRTEDDFAHVEVCDTGEGMSKEDLARIGEAFFQGNNAKGRTGTGLGLSIVMLLAENMGGRVTLESELGEGTHARVYLPVITEDAPAEPEQVIEITPAKAGEAS